MTWSDLTLSQKLAAALLVIVGISTLYGMVVNAPPDEPASAARGATPTYTTTPTSPSLANAITAWGQGGGADVTMRLARAAKLVGTAGNDAALVRSYCTNLDEVAAEAQKYPPVPDPVANQHWMRALGYTRDSARYCVYTATTGNAAYVKPTTDAANMINVELKLVADRVAAIRAGGY